MTTYDLYLNRDGAEREFRNWLQPVTAGQFLTDVFRLAAYSERELGVPVEATLEITRDDSAQQIIPAWRLPLVWNQIKSGSFKINLDNKKKEGTAKDPIITGQLALRYDPKYPRSLWLGGRVSVSSEESMLYPAKAADFINHLPRLD